MDSIPVKVTCRCGAKLETKVHLPSEARRATNEFNESHKECRTQSAWDIVFGPDAMSESQRGNE